MLLPDSDDTERPTCAKRNRERLNTLKVFALAASSLAGSSLLTVLQASGQFVGGTVTNNRDFLVGTAAACIGHLQFERDRRQADEAFRTSDEYNIKQAVEKLLRPYEVTEPQKQVVERDVMDVVKRIISDWQPNAATVVNGRYSAGKTVAVNEALRGVRGVFQFDIKSADWEKLMHEKMARKSCAVSGESLKSSRTIRPSSPHFCLRFTAKS